jgi:hypothetical protein
MKYAMTVIDELGFKWEQILTSKTEVTREVSKWLLTIDETPIDKIEIFPIDD